MRRRALFAVSVAVQCYSTLIGLNRQIGDRIINAQKLEEREYEKNADAELNKQNKDAREKAEKNSKTKKSIYK
jgi:hypothetical protein